MSTFEFKNQVRSIDIYVTYKCNLRCKHCFLGEKLNTGSVMDWQLLTRLLQHARTWGTEEVTFLGGEPTLYPKLDNALTLTSDLGMRSRIVTNGQRPFLNHLHALAEAGVHVCFSIDGSSPTRHDAMRGSETFDKLVASVAAAKAQSIPCSGIVSLDRNNVDNSNEILVKCHELGLEYVNVHYVTNRGFARENSVLSIDEWRHAVDGIAELSRSLPLDIRVERTFTAQKDESLRCAVREGSNMMVFPDGRVYQCAMFIDNDNSHSFVWTLDGLVENESSASEKRVCANECSIHCPAMKQVNSRIAEEAESRGLAVRCIYDKSCLRMGKEVADDQSKHL